MMQAHASNSTEKSDKQGPRPAHLQVKLTITANGRPNILFDKTILEKLLALNLERAEG
jgi:hypothetical protein